VEGAEVGDAVALRIEDVQITSLASSSGHDQPMDGRLDDDPCCAGHDPRLPRRR
jgi:hypothetical protein